MVSHRWCRHRSVHGRGDAQERVVERLVRGVNVGDDDRSPCRHGSLQSSRLRLQLLLGWDVNVRKRSLSFPLHAGHVARLELASQSWCPHVRCWRGVGVWDVDGLRGCSSVVNSLLEIGLRPCWGPSHFAVGTRLQGVCLLEAGGVDGDETSLRNVWCIE